eukprot:4734641-Prymnesium_polylepis.1
MSQAASYAPDPNRHSRRRRTRKIQQYNEARNPIGGSDAAGSPRPSPLWPRDWACDVSAPSWNSLPERQARMRNEAKQLKQQHTRACAAKGSGYGFGM